MLITSKSNNKIKEARKLLDSKYSKNKELFLIEGENLVYEAIKNNLLVDLFVLENEVVDFKFDYNYVTLDVMKSLSNLKSTPRVIGISKYINKNNIGNKIVLLDDIQDPGNAGTIIRNSVAFGIDTVIFSNNSVNPYNEKVLRSTGGMIYNINIKISSIEKEINDIKSKGITLIGTSLKKTKPLNELDKKEKFAIIFGNEGNGVKEDLLNKCDEIVRIDMMDDCESLNVGVSNGIILYHMFKR